MGSNAVVTGTPLAGAFICCTSIDADTRDHIHKAARDMGAECSFDLTVKATHLIVGATDSLKYDWVAKERPDVKVLFPQFIEALREIWIKGEEANITDLEEQHRVPALYGQRICITGFTRDRDRLTSTIQENGAEYHADLTKKVTQLIVHQPTGRKYEFALIWGLKVVGEEWLRESVVRGMRLDETLFNPNIPPHKRGQGAWKKSLSEDYVAQLKRLRDDTVKTEAPKPNKLRRTMSNRQKSDMQTMWADMKAVATSSKTSQQKSEWGENNETSQPAASSETLDASNVNRNNAPNLLVPGPQNIFTGLTVFAHGFSQTKFQILEKHITSHGGTLTDTLTLLPSDSPTLTSSSYLMLPSDMTEKALSSCPEPLKDCTKVNEWWIVTSLVAKKLILPPENRFCQHFYTGKIPGFEQLAVCSSGFTGPDLLHLQRTTELLGGKYHEFLTSNASLLICGPKPSADKIQLTKTHSIPTVSISWLWACIDAEFKIDYDQYLWQNMDIERPLGFPEPRETTNIAPLKKAKPQYKVHEIKFKEIKAKHADGPNNQLTRMPFDIDEDDDQGENDAAVTQDISIEQDDSATFDIHEEQAPAHPLGTTSPSKLNSPQKHTPKSADYSLDSIRDQAQTSDNAKERTLALSAILESKIANRSQSDGVNDGHSKKQRVRVLGRATSTSKSNSMNVDDGCSSRKQPDSDMTTRETFASQRLEYDDVEMMKKRAKLMAALTEGTVAPEEATVDEPEGGRRRSHRKRP